jgi:hypothetical protein
MKEPTPQQRKKGQAFAKALENNDLTKAEFARKMGLPQDSGAQTVQNWTLRGVSTKRSVRAAKLLNCSPDDISLVSTEEDSAVRENRNPYGRSSFRRLSPREELLEIFDDLDEDRQQRLIEYARDQAKASHYEKTKGGRRETLPTIPE